MADKQKLQKEVQHQIDGFDEYTDVTVGLAQGLIDSLGGDIEVRQDMNPTTISYYITLLSIRALMESDD